MSRFLSILIIFILSLAASIAAQAITIDTVTVGNPGNAPDTAVMNDGTTGYGEVDYTYKIGKFEITAGQYVAFLNAVAKTADPYHLLGTGMGNTSSTWMGCNITVGGTPGNYVYSVPTDWANRPVNYVDWGSAARFCNWLYHGQPNTGVEDATTTEDGSYDLNGAVTDEALSTIKRKTTATWVIPSENEWYKAAYYDPNKNGTGSPGYWLYPTKSDDLPSNVLSNPDSGNNANFVQGGAYTIGGSYYRTTVGAFSNSEGPYNTFDQGGNIEEWNETSLRGGSFGGPSICLAASFRGYPTLRGSTGCGDGFRVAYVPEPSCILLFVAASMCVIIGSKHWKRIML
jgi:formylglycine-generating enzyme